MKSAVLLCCGITLVSAVAFAEVKTVAVEDAVVGDSCSVDARWLDGFNNKLKAKLTECGLKLITAGEVPNYRFKSTIVRLDKEKFDTGSRPKVEVMRCTLAVKADLLNGETSAVVDARVLEGVGSAKTMVLSNGQALNIEQMALDGAVGQVFDGLGAMLKTALAKASPKVANPKDCEIVIMEEPPTEGQMKVDAAFGTGLDGAKFFYQNYTLVQRKVRDFLVEKARGCGFSPKLLSGNDAYSRFATKDQTLVGVYYDVNLNQPVVNRELFNEVRDTSPEAYILYYRLDSLSYDAETRTVRTTVALSLMHPHDNTTIPMGERTHSCQATTGMKDVIMDEVASAVRDAFDRLWIGNDVGQKVLESVAQAQNDVDADKPLKLTVNGNAFDAKCRKKALYAIKKALLSKKLCENQNIKATDNVLHATITNPEISETDVLYMEYLDPILTEMGIELQDDQVNYNGNEVIIKPGK